MTRMVNLYEAKTHLSQLVEEAANGGEIIIAKAGKPAARLVPLAAAKQPRKPGGWKGRIWFADDFDADMTDEEMAAWYGETESEPEP